MLKIFIFIPTLQNYTGSIVCAMHKIIAYHLLWINGSLTNYVFMKNECMPK